MDSNFMYHWEIESTNAGNWTEEPYMNVGHQKPQKEMAMRPWNWVEGRGTLPKIWWLGLHSEFPPPVWSKHPEAGTFMPGLSLAVPQVTDRGKLKKTWTSIATIRCIPISDTLIHKNVYIGEQKYRNSHSLWGPSQVLFRVWSWQ